MPALFNSKHFNHTLKLLCAASIIVLSFIGFYFFKADFWHLAIFVLFILFYVLFPGLFLLRYADIKSPYTSVNFSLGFFLGFALNVIVYFVSEVLNSDILLYLLGPALSLLYSFIFFKEHTNPTRMIRDVIKGIPTSLYIFFTLVFAYAIFTTQYTYIPPDAANYAKMKTDFSFHAGIVNALALCFPPRNPWVSGLSISYHMFTELLYSIPVRIFGLRSEEIILSCTPYVISPLFSCSAYGFFREFTTKKDYCGLYCLSLILSNMFMIRAFSASWFLYHLCSNINNTGFGISALLVLLVFIRKIDGTHNTHNAVNIKYLTVLSTLVMLTTGIKGPIAIVFVSAMIGTVLLALILRRVNYGMLSATFVSVISFVLIYVYILGSRGSSSTNGSGGSLLNPWEVTDIFYLKDSIMQTWPRPLASIILLATFFVFLFTAFTIPFVVAYTRELFLVLSKRKEFTFSRVMIYATCLVGLIALMLFNYSGHSQVYFGFVSMVLAPSISYLYFEDMGNYKNCRPVTKAIWASFLVCLCVSTLTFFIHIKDYTVQSYSKYINRYSISNSYRSVSASEYEGLIWLRDNTDKTAIIASDRYYSVPLEEYDYTVRSHNTHFGYAIYSQREQYLEGSGFSVRSSESDLRKTMIENLKQMMDPDNMYRDELARSLGVDYILISKRYNDVGDLSSGDYTLVFTNEDVDIYQVENPS